MTKQPVQVRGRTAIYDIVKHPGSVGVLARKDEQILLVRQHRPAVGMATWEIPAGTLNENEDPLACAQRELEEEAGVVAARWQALGRLMVAPGYSDEVMHLFEAHGFSETSQRFDDTEEILAVEWFAEAEILACGEQAATTKQADAVALDAKTLAALAWSQLRGRSLDPAAQA